jgi:hypothetical protein
MNSSMRANSATSFIRRASDARATRLCPVSPAFNPLGWATFALAAFPDHSTLQQRRDNIAAILIEQTSNIGHLESVVEEEVANCNGSLGLGIEIHRVSRHVKSTRMDLEAVSGFTVGLFHRDISSLERKSKSHGKQKREGCLSYRRDGWGTFRFYFTRG